MRCILIDPSTITIKEVETECSLQDIYNLIECSMVTCPLILANEDALYLDDEALLAAPPYYRFRYTVNGQSYTFTGKCLIIGTDNEGANEAAKSNLQDIIRSVEWLGVENEEIEPEIRFIPLSD